MAKTSSVRGKPVAKASSSGLLPWLSIATIVILLDQLTKTLILRTFRYGDAHTVTSFFDIVRAHNRGAAFSFLNQATEWQRWLFTGIGVAAAVFIVFMLRRHGGQKLFATALSLVLGGALGNVIDRLLHGYVVDFLSFHHGAWTFPAFNVADSAISVGAAFLILDELLRVRRGR
jgi:signal peptidase II